jgi:hypothetical protein
MLAPGDCSPSRSVVSKMRTGRALDEEGAVDMAGLAGTTGNALPPPYLVAAGSTVILPPSAAVRHLRRPSRGLRGGFWNGVAVGLSSSSRNAVPPLNENGGLIGFRLASPVAVPEPSTYSMALAGLACGGYSMFRRRKRA